jgi:hypothetical protein
MERDQNVVYISISTTEENEAIMHAIWLVGFDVFLRCWLGSTTSI